MAIDLSGLEHFKSVLGKTKENVKVNKKNSKIKRILDIAVEELKIAYAGKKVKIVVDTTDDGFTIYVKDTKAQPTIAFEEFGTGYYASGSYLGELPTQKITFTSAGKTHSTKGWEYYYPNKDTKRTYGGMKGWLTPNGVFHIGQKANSTMYKACKKIIQRLRSEDNNV